MSIKQDQYTLIDDTGREAVAIKTKAGMGFKMKCVRTQGCLLQSSRPIGCLSLRRARTSVQDTEGSCHVCVSFNTAAILLWSPGAQVRCVHKDWVCTSHLMDRMGLLVSEACLGAITRKLVLM
jgi:hypothetical protein